MYCPLAQFGRTFVFQVQGHCFQFTHCCDSLWEFSSFIPVRTRPFKMSQYKTKLGHLSWFILMIHPPESNCALKSNYEKPCKAHPHLIMPLTSAGIFSNVSKIVTFMPKAEVLKPNWAFTDNSMCLYKTGSKEIILKLFIITTTMSSKAGWVRLFID